MTPKEKAQELINKFDLPSGLMSSERKQCALIAVDEIISACEYNHVESYNTEWWNKVKQEIEKL